MINADIVLARRTQRGLSQRQLAKHAGVSYMTISRMEDGADSSNLPLSVLGRLAAALDADPAELLTPNGRTGPGSSTSSPMSSMAAHDHIRLDHNAARLLRKIHRGNDIRRTMSRADRDLTLPALVNSGLVTIDNSGVHLAPPVRSSLMI